MELLMTFLAKDQGVPLSCGHHTLPQFLSFRYIFQLPNVMNFKAAFRCLTIFTLLPVEPLDDLRSAKRPERGIWLHVQVWIVWHRFSQVFESKHSDGAGLVLTLYGEYLTIIRFELFGDFVHAALVLVRQRFEEACAPYPCQFGHGCFGPSCKSVVVRQTPKFSIVGKNDFGI